MQPCSALEDVAAYSAIAVSYTSKMLIALATGIDEYIA